MIITIANQKGGCGKSTIAVNLAVSLSIRGKNVVLVDADAQATSTKFLDDRRSAFPQKPSPWHLQSWGDILYDRINMLSHGHEYVIVDVGGFQSNTTDAAISACDKLVVPVLPSDPDLWATQQFVNFYNDLYQKEAHIIINRYQTNRFIVKKIEADLEKLRHAKVMEARLHDRTIYAKCFSELKSVSEISHSSLAHQEFDNFLHEVIES